MASQLEQFGFIRRSSTLETQNQLSQIVLCINSNPSIESTIKNEIQNELIEQILTKEDSFLQSGKDKTIKKKTQAIVNKFNKSQNLNGKQYSAFNIQNSQFALIFNSNSSKQNNKTSSISSNQQNNQKNDKQAIGIQNLENNSNQEFQKINLTSNENLKQYFNKISECIFEQINQSQEMSIYSSENKLIQLENQNLEKKNVIEQLLIQSNFSDQLSQKNMKAYKEDSLSLSEVKQLGDGNFNYFDKSMQLIQNYTKPIMNEIVSSLEKYSYRLIEKVQTSEYVDIFFGYQDQDSIKSQTLVVMIFNYLSLKNQVIQQQPIQNQNLGKKESKLIDLIDAKYQFSCLDMQKLIQTIEWYENVKLKNDRIISLSNNNTMIVMKRDNYIQIIHKYIEYREQIKVWNEEYFKQFNQNQELFTNINNKLFQKFIQNQDIIFKKLKENNYYICKYVSKGEQDITFEGYQQIKFTEYSDFIFKVVFCDDEQEIDNLIRIMKNFEKNTNFIKCYDKIKVENQIYVLVIGKCKYSLSKELQLYSDKEAYFTDDKLAQIIFDLLDGLMLIRLYDNFHLEIKPANIFVSFQGNYLYSDFGISSFKKADKQIKAKDGIPQYEPPEEKEQDNLSDLKSDIYSLGKAFIQIIEVYEKESKQTNFIQQFKCLVEDEMIKQLSEQTIDCFKLHKQFLMIIVQLNSKNFFKVYLDNIKNILDQLPENKDKDTLYLTQISLYYNQIALDISSNKFIDIQTHSQLETISKYFCNVSLCHQKLNQYQESFEFQMKSYEIIRQIYQANHPQFSSSLFQVAQCYQYLYQYEKALDFSLKSLQINKQIYQGNNLKIAQSLCQVAECYQNLNQYEKALDFSLESLQMKKQIYQGNHSNISSSLYQVAECYGKLCQYEKSLEFSLQSLQMNKQIYQGNHSYISQSLFQVAECYGYLSSYEKALDFSLQSLQMNKLIYQGNHSKISSSLFQVAQCYGTLKQYDRALDFSLQSLQMNKQIYYGNHSSISQSLFQVAECYGYLNQYKKALDFSLQSLQMNKLIYQGNHSSISQSLYQAAQCYASLNQHKKALDFLLQSLQMNKQIYQNNHSSISQSLYQAAQCYGNLRQYDRALDFSLQSLQMNKQIYQGNHSQISQSLFQVAECYGYLCQYEKALNFSLNSLQMNKQIYQGNHSSISQSLYQVAQCYGSLRQYEKALDFSLQSLQMKKYIYQGNHQQILSSLYQVAECYKNLNQNEKAQDFLLQSMQMHKLIYQVNY